MRKARDWLFTIPFFIAFGLIVVVFDLAMRVARRISPKAMGNVVSGLQKSLVAALRICGTKIVVERHPDVKPGTPYVILTNHQSMYDIPLFGAELFSNHVKYVSKRELGGYIPSISYNLKYGGNALIDRGDRRQAIEAIRDLGRRVQRDGVAALIFPEGTRARDGQPAHYRTAGAKALLQSAPDVEVIPAAVDGTWILGIDEGGPVPFGTTIRIALGRPLARRPNDEVELIEQSEKWMHARLDDWRT
jgi:1-acyl-sn-glycerol-3-phosphate acyltransferase